jgi:26S proteasome regulatory subunit N8
MPLVKKAEAEVPAAPPPPPHSILPETIVVHPLVLLSVVDHYNRVALQVTSKRVVGILLGETYKGRVDVSNSFAVPFEEDPKDDSIWFLDHDYAESMFRMFAKVNAKEKIVGFYSTGPKLRSNDLAIDADFRTRYCAHSASPPILCIIDVRPDSEGIPTQAYYSVEQIADEDKATKRTFRHVQSEVGAYEAEEVGVEHLLRDINDPTVSTLASRVRQKMTGLRGLKGNLLEMHDYLANVAEGRLPVNHRIVDNLQEIVNLLPNLNVDELVRAFLVKSNDMNLVIYVSSLVRAIVALHNLLTNKIQLKEGATPAAAAAQAKNGEKKDGEKKDGEQKKEDKKSSS